MSIRATFHYFQGMVTVPALLLRRDPPVRRGRRPRYSPAVLRRWNQCRTRRKNIPGVPGTMAEISGIVHRIQTDREDGNKLFFAYASY